MNSFQIIVLGIAVSLLIIILAVIGVIMVNNSNNLIFPPNSLPCPNYWQLNSDGTCNIPISSTSASTAVNIGSFDTAKTTTTPGFDKTKNTINFSDNGWGANSSSATCAKKAWANSAGILWDGITNYNGCE